MKMRLASPLQSDSIVDGPGIRCVIWTQGCSHHCPGCHNPETHDFNGGYEIDTKTIKEQLSTLTYQDGITLSGGDPFFQPDACTEIALYCKKRNWNVWCYTGYTFEELLALSKTKLEIKNFLESIDVLVDGKFKLEKKSLNLYFRGSTNQRILNLPESLTKQKAILIPDYQEKKASTCYHESSHTSKNIFI